MESGDETNTCGFSEKNINEEKSRGGGILRRLILKKVPKTQVLSDDQTQLER